MIQYLAMVMQAVQEDVRDIIVSMTGILLIADFGEPRSMRCYGSLPCLQAREFEEIGSDLRHNRLPQASSLSNDDVSLSFLFPLSSSKHFEHKLQARCMISYSTAQWENDCFGVQQAVSKRGAEYVEQW